MRYWSTKGKVTLWVSITSIFAILIHGGMLLEYLLNRAFIQANLKALPFRYALALHFAQFEWWTFVISIGGGLLIAFIIWWGPQ